MPIYNIHHITQYEYDRPVKESTNEIKIYPYNCAEQEVLQHEINISDNPDVFLYQDYFGNKTGLFNLLSPHKELVIESKLTIRTTSSAQLRMNFNEGWDHLKSILKNNLQLLELSKPDSIQAQQHILDIIKDLQPVNKSVATFIEDCNAYIYNNFRYIKGITDIETTVDEILKVKAGVCQDFAHVMLQILRTLHIPCRYVSGYICPNKNGMRGEAATHAWIEAYIPDYGFAGIDPTNNVWVTNNHVKLAIGKHFNDCTPAKGTFKGPARQKLSVYVSIGYEDGQTFENKTNVQMQTVASNEKELLIDEGFAGQQQQ